MIMFLYLEYRRRKKKRAMERWAPSCVSFRAGMYAFAEPLSLSLAALHLRIVHFVFSTPLAPIRISKKNFYVDIVSAAV